MTILVSDKQIRSQYSMSRCIEAVEEAFGAAGRDSFEVSERKVVAVEGGARLLSLTAASAELESLVAHVYSGAPAGHDKQRSPVNRRQKLYLVFDSATGACEAIIGGEYLSWLKTGAMGAVAIKHLSSPTAEDLAVLGSGRQARAALAGALEVRPFSRVRIWSRTRAHAAKMAEEFPQVPAIEISASAQEAVRGADVIVTATTSTTPILLGDWLSPGCHVNAIGAHYPDHRELDGEAVRRSTVVVDTHVAARAEKGELLLAVKEGLFTFDEVAGELGEIVAGKSGWSRSEEESTLFASCGSAIESLGAAWGVLAGMQEEDRFEF
ncbi:MAG TPA: ornithine cyclodeaminase family protein [Acidimicrobiia bacterium]|nr:ornithine cyclodeaminase family protein [Acidimicrobiia bacterium]